MMLGNLSVKKMEERMGIDFPEELKETLVKYRQENVSIDIAEGFWHCFDMPFTFVCGGKDLAQFMYDYLSPMASSIKTPLQVSVVKTKKGYTKDSTP